MAADTDIWADPDGLPVPGTRAVRHARRPWYVKSFVVIAAVTAVAGGLRFYRLSTPHSYVFDEVYYAKDGCFDAGFPYKACHLDTPGEQTVTVHPPLGRWIIAGGEWIFGNRPFGWRVASATFGTISVLLLSILALRVFGSALWAGVTGLLLATESLNFVQSRVSMLDIFLTAFVVAGFLFLVLDRQWIERRMLAVRPPEEAEEFALLDMPPDRPPSPIVRPWRLAAGVALGAATAVKWSGALALLAAVILALAWERSRRARIGLPHPFREALRDESFGIFVFLVVVPLAVYVASYARWFADNGFKLGDWWSLQRGMASYSIHLRATHPYASKAWTWILLKRPVAYYYKGDAVAKTSAEILGLGNPAIFWGSLIALPYAVFAWIRTRDWRPGLMVVPFALQYVPWLFAARTNFLFYMAPLTPFMVLAVAYGLKDMSEARIGMERMRALAPIAAFAVIASVGLFVFFLPVLTGRTIPTSSWNERIWFSCASNAHCFWNWV